MSDVSYTLFFVRVYLYDWIINDDETKNYMVATMAKIIYMEEYLNDTLYSPNYGNE